MADHGRTTKIGAAVLASLLALLAAATTAGAQGPSSAQLSEAGWTCFTPPPRPDLIACYNPGQGRPIPGNPEPPASYSVRTFSSADGAFLSTGTLIRADLYNGRVCGPTGEPYVFLGLIGYYECTHR